MQKKVAQLWFRNSKGEEFAFSHKFYSKVGVAENLAKEYNENSSSFYFVKVYNLEYIGDIK
jgi:hypothetical protein